MTEGMVSEWFIPDGGEVKKGELLYALETEKVNLDVDAEADGIVKHLVQTGINLKPGDVVGYIYEAGEEIPDSLPTPGAAPAEEASAEAEPAAEAAPVTAAPVASTGEGGRIKASPAARRLARELGVDYTTLGGSGPGGRIVEADVQAAAGGGTAVTAAAPAQLHTAPPAAAVPAADVKASPLAKRIAAERGIDLRTIRGSGPGGRIVQADVEGAGSAPAAAPAAVAAAAGPAPGEVVPIKGMRRTIATRMHQSLMEAAQLTMDMKAVMDGSVALRTQLIKEWEGEARPTYTDLVIRAVTKALQKHPMMNSQWTEDGIQVMTEINVGIAVALPEGLVVPVLRGADQRDLKSLAIESARLAAAARDGQLGLDDYAGGTFTVSALGMYGVDSFTPIINQPQSGILGINQLMDGLAWDGDTPVKQKQMNLSLTWDHRVLDGAPAAEFLKSVVEFLSEPYRLLV